MLASQSRYPDRVARWSEAPSTDKDILWIDTIGLLAKLYHYGDVAYVGGGFRKGLHNILEAIAFGCPVAFGPQHANRPEATDILAKGASEVVTNATEVVSFYQQYLDDPERLAQARLCNKAYVAERTGATKQMATWVKEQPWGKKG